MHILTRFLRGSWRWLAGIVVVFIITSVFQVLLCRFVDPPVTPLMLLRAFEGLVTKGSTGRTQKFWRDADQVSPHFFRATLAAEDARFFNHCGFDWRAIRRAWRYNARRSGRGKLGGSTISMQTAKNVFLWPSRNYLRKGLEAWYTLLIECCWSKERILEIYVNIVELGDGIYGVEAAAQHYFHKSAAGLNPDEAAMLAAILPAPRSWRPLEPSSYLQKRRNRIIRRMKSIRLPNL